MKKDLKELYYANIEKWMAASKKEKEAAVERRHAEQVLFNITFPHEVGDNLSLGDLNIFIEEKEIWNNDQVSLLYSKYIGGPAGSSLNDFSVFCPFPFTPTWKPVPEAHSFIKKERPTYYKNKIEPLKCTKREKPVFSIKKENAVDLLED